MHEDRHQEWIKKNSEKNRINCIEGIELVVQLCCLFGYSQRFIIGIKRQIKKNLRAKAL